MNKLMMQVGGVVAAVTIFALLAGVGYLTQIGLTQTFGPSDPGTQDNIAERKPRGNRVFENRASPDDPPRVEGWVDVPEADLTNDARLKNRPGNFEAIPVVIDFLDGLYQVEPEYRNLSFPFQLDSKLIESEETFEGWSQPDRSGVNRIRRSNVEVVSIDVFNFEPDAGVEQIPESMGFRAKEPERLQKLRDHYAGRIVLVSLVIRTESLDSEEVRSDEATRFALHRDLEGQWKIIYCVG